jgi:hypothetical protein
MTDYDGQTPGVAPCHGCGGSVLFAVPDGEDGTVVALDPDDRGLLVAWEDAETARCRPVKATYQLALGEFLFRFHDPVCPALAPVRPIGMAPSVRSRRPVRTSTERRASAR